MENATDWIIPNPVRNSRLRVRNGYQNVWALRELTIRVSETFAIGMKPYHFPTYRNSLFPGGRVRGDGNTQTRPSQLLSEA
jgi:hypothetical protein